MLWFSLRSVALYHLTLTIDQKLGEVPFNPFGSHDAFRLLLEPGVEGVGIRAVDIDLGKNRKGRTEARGAEFNNFFVGSWFLLAKLITGKGQHLKTFVMIVRLKLFQSVVLRREAAF